MQVGEGSPIPRYRHAYRGLVNNDELWSTKDTNTHLFEVRAFYRSRGFGSLPHFCWLVRKMNRKCPF